MIVIFVSHRQQPSGASGGCGAAPGSVCSGYFGLPRAFVVVSFVPLRCVPAGPSGRSDLSRQLPRCSLPTRRLVLLGPKNWAATSRGLRKPFVCHRFCLSLWREGQVCVAGAEGCQPPKGFSQCVAVRVSVPQVTSRGRVCL